MKTMTNPNIIALTGLLLLTTSCWGTDRQLFVENDFSPEEYELIGSAAAEWGSAADSDEARYLVAGTFQGRRDFSYEHEYSGAHESAAIFKLSMVTERAGYQDLLEDAGSSDDICGIANVDYGRIVIVSECVAALTASEFRGVVLHELGHLLGLHDSDAGLMSDDPNNQNYDDCVDQDALDEICAIVDCGPHAHATCPE